MRVRDTSLVLVCGAILASAGCTTTIDSSTRAPGIGPDHGGPPGPDPDGIPPVNDPIDDPVDDPVDRPRIPPEPSGSTEQRHWDFGGDHAFQFTPQDIRLVEQDGPYGIYEVTGPEPLLVGPELTNPFSGRAQIMICAGWFTFRAGAPWPGEDRSDTPGRLEIVDLGTDEVIAEKVILPIQGGCSPPSDVGYPYEGQIPKDFGIRLSGAEEGTFVAIARISMDSLRLDYHPGEMPNICCGGCDPQTDEFCPQETDGYCALDRVWVPPPADEPPYSEVVSEE